MSQVVIVGAGLAGLAAAVSIHDRGHDVVVLEASDGVGGRVRSDVVDGYTLDRGFQILLTAYPVAQRVFDYESLDLRRFHAGSLVQLDSGRVLVGDPLRRPGDLLETVRAPVGSPIDKARLLAWRRQVMSGSLDELWAKGECTTNTRFADLKFSEPFGSTALSSRSTLLEWISPGESESMLTPSSWRLTWTRLRRSSTHLPLDGTPSRPVGTPLMRRRSISRCCC